MSESIKNQQKILNKLGISALNKMQVDARKAVIKGGNILILSPTGTGKTLAFLLPILSELDPGLQEVQALVITPSRELAMQIEGVAREMGTGFKVNVVYGGRNVSKDMEDLKTPPALLIGTPGRISDHMERGTCSLDHIKYLVLDEFDKSLEIGFETEMSKILRSLPSIQTKILTSATQGVEIPSFVSWEKPITLDYLEHHYSGLQIKKVTSPSKDKLEILSGTLEKLGDQAGIVFCNFKDSIARVSDFLKQRGIPHGCFYGGMEQIDRERALVKFRNGTHHVLLATDLAARGLDVPDLDYIIHYHLPLKEEEFTHRNGRTARMQADGIAYVLKWAEEELPDFIGKLEEATFDQIKLVKGDSMATLFISGGRKDKISKGDIAGLFFKKGQLQKDELGVIELKQDCAFVGVPQEKVKDLIKTLDNQRIKKRKVRIREI